MKTTFYGISCKFVEHVIASKCAVCMTQNVPTSNEQQVTPIRSYRPWERVTIDLKFRESLAEYNDGYIGVLNIVYPLTFFSIA